MGYVARGVIVLLLTVVVLKESAGFEEAIGSYELILVYLAVGVVALAAYAWHEDERSLAGLREGVPSLLKLAGGAVVTAVLLVVTVRLNGSGLPGANWALTLGAIYLLVLAYPLFHHDVKRLVVRNWPYLLAFAALWGVYLFHASSLGPSSGRAAFSIAVGFLLVANLFVVPRFVPVDDFLWAAARVSAGVVGLGMLAYLLGDYTALSVPVRLWSTSFSPRLLPVEIPLLQSIFPNPNTTGILVFVGTLAALAELHRAVDRTAVGDGGGGSSELALLVPGALLAVNGVGLYLTHSRASLLAAGAGGIVYVAGAWLGRDTLPHAVFAASALVFAGLVAVASGLVNVNPGGRFVLWSAGVEAFLRSPTLLGQGIVDSGEVIAPYVTDPGHRGASVHNSYLNTAIRAGLLGVAAHVVLAVGSVVHGVLPDREVAVAAVALAFGFAVHQLFESYTVFHHSLGALLAALAVGYAIAWVPAGEERAEPAEGETRSIADVFGQRG